MFLKKIKLTSAQLLLVICSFFYSEQKAQSGKNFYLIDSIDISTVAIQDKLLMDSILSLYHKEVNDTVKLELLDFLANNCSETIWPSYNRYILSQTELLLKTPGKYSEKALKKIKGARANSLVNSGVYFAGIEEFDEAIKYYQSGLEGFREAGDKLGESNTIFNIAGLYIRQNKINQALDLLNENTKLAKELKNDKVALYTYNTLGIVYSNQGQIEKALENLYKALKIEEQNGDTPLLAALLSNIGVIQYNLKNVEGAMQNYERSLQIAEKINHRPSMIKALEHIALVFSDKNEFDKALEYNKRSLAINESLNNFKGMGYTYGNIALNYSKQKDFKNAELYYLKAIQILEKNNFKVPLANNLKNIGHFYAKQRQFEKAKTYGQRALKISRELGYPENIQQAAGLLKEVYVSTGNWKGAYEMGDLYAQMNDSIHSSSTQKAMIKNQLEYEYQKEKLADSLNFARQKEIKDLLIAKQESQLSKEKSQRFSLLGILLLVIILSSVLYRNYKANLRTNELIQIQKKQVEQKNAENETLLSEIHHRVKNNLQVISSLLSLQERSVGSGKAKSALHEGKERIKSMELVHKLLYQKGSFTGIGMQEYIRMLVEGLLESFGKEKGDVDLDLITEDLTLDVDTAIPIGLILNELVVNALKHSKTKKGTLQLSIKLFEKDGQLCLEVKDNGTGKLQEIESSDSFGMKIINALLRQLNGQMEIQENNGLGFSLTFNQYKLVARGH